MKLLIEFNWRGIRSVADNYEHGDSLSDSIIREFLDQVNNYQLLRSCIVGLGSYLGAYRNQTYHKDYEGFANKKGI
jgi:hypothetical protein